MAQSNLMINYLPKIKTTKQNKIRKKQSYSIHLLRMAELGFCFMFRIVWLLVLWYYIYIKISIFNFNNSVFTRLKYILRSVYFENHISLFKERIYIRFSFIQTVINPHNGICFDNHFLAEC